MEEIKVFTDKGFSLKDAWKYVKPTIIKESETTRDFDVKGKVKSSKVDLTKLPMNEAYEEGRLTPEQRKEWRKIHMG